MSAYVELQEQKREAEQELRVRPSMAWLRLARAVQCLFWRALCSVHPVCDVCSSRDLCSASTMLESAADMESAVRQSSTRSGTDIGDAATSCFGESTRQSCKLSTRGSRRCQPTCLLRDTRH
eukprot:1696195-Rhodomonas_salina.2